MQPKQQNPSQLSQQDTKTFQVKSNSCQTEENFSWLLELESVTDEQAFQIDGGRGFGGASSSRNTVSTQMPSNYSMVAQVLTQQ